MLSPLLMVVLAGLTAVGFLIAVWQGREKVPAPLRFILIVAAVAVVAYVGWTLLNL